LFHTSLGGSYGQGTEDLTTWTRCENWSVHDGMINCEVISPRKPGREWQLFSAFLGRLADRYANQIIGINIQFPAEPSESPKATVKKRRRMRRRK